MNNKELIFTLKCLSEQTINDKIKLDLLDVEKELEVLEIIKEISFIIEFDESQNEWSLYIPNEESCTLVAKGTGIKTYNLLKEVLL